MASVLARFVRVASTTLIALATGAACAQSSVDDLFKSPKFNLARLSPNGKYLATTTKIGERVQLAVVEVATSVAKNVVGYENLDVAHIQWINDDRIVYDVVNIEGEQTSTAGGLFAVNRDGTHFKMLTRFGHPGALLGRSMNDDPNSILIVGVPKNGDTALPYRLDTLTARWRPIDFDFDGFAQYFLFDALNVVRVVVTSNGEQSRETVWYLDGVGQAWRKLIEQPTYDQKFSVLAFDNDNKTLFVVAQTEDGRDGIYKYDFAKNQPGELVASDKTVDVNSLVSAPDTLKVLGVRMQTEPPRTLWFDSSMAAIQEGIDRALPGAVNQISPSNAKAPMLVFSYSSTNPGHYYLFDPVERKLKNLFAVRPWIDSSKMSTQLAYDYVARDGLPIMAYVTLPKGRAAKALPMVVLLHGGPWARDHWGFDPEVQFLAGLGYVVLQPQFRGSSGFGAAHLKKSFGQWGLSMQDDVTDGVTSLVKQGIVDPKRVCIMGASYGGYAVMQGLVKDPDLYRCGVNLLGVTNLFYISSEDSRRYRAASYHRNQTLGDPDKLRDQFKATSPSRHADAIKAPVFMVYGGKDRRVPLIHGEEMRDGLKKFNKVYEYMELEDEEHGIADEKTRLRVFSGIETFLKKYNPAQ